MEIERPEDKEYESNEAYLIILMKDDDNIRDILSLFEKEDDARKFIADFGNKNRHIRLLPIPFFRSKK